MTQCTAITRKGTQCKNSAVTNTNPPRCSIPSHQTNPDTPTRKRAGAPPGNKNAEKHGAYSRPPAKATARTTTIIEDLTANIEDLQNKREQVSRNADASKDNLDALEYAKVIDLLGRLDSRIARLYRELRELTGQGTDETQNHIDNALALVWEALKIQKK